MIDEKKLNEAYRNNGFYSLQLEVGDVCYQGCIYCYMNALEDGRNTLSDEDITNILLDAKEIGITAIEWLGGEPLLRGNIFTHMEKALELGFRNNMWTGGLVLSSKKIREKLVGLTGRGLIAFHLSTVNPEVYRILHPGRPEDDVKRIIDGVEKILELGYPPEQMLNSVTYTGLQSPEDMIETIDYFEERYGIRTSLNIYHTYLRPGTPPGELERFVPALEDVIKVHKRYARQWGAKNLPLNCVNRQYCSTTVAVLCDGSVTPCATIRPENAPNIHRDGNLAELINKYKEWLTLSYLRDNKNLPEGCKECAMNDICFGCRSRAYASGESEYGIDPMCFRNRYNLSRAGRTL